LKSALNLEQLKNRYELANRADGKSPATVEGYNQILRAFIGYLKDYEDSISLSCFTIDMARAYMLYLRERPKYQGHPFTPARGNGLSIESIRDHVRTLKAFSTWLHVEEYTEENRLKNLKLPKPDELIIEPLTDDEKTIILDAINQKTYTGRRDYAISVLLFDTGLRAGEVAESKKSNLNSGEGFLKVFGKGRKERLVPIGFQTLSILLEYLTYVRPQVARPDCDNLFVSESGGPISVNVIKLLFSRLAKKSGITRLHAHLCRHTFAIDYLMNGGDIFSLKEILGHSSLEMVNRYLHFTQAKITARHREFSPMDRFMDNHQKRRKPKN